MTWWVYIIQADDGSLYTGVTTDIARRFSEHRAGRKGARYFSGRRPVGVVFTEKWSNRSEAQQREAEIKSLRRGDKLKLLQNCIEYQ